MIAAPAKGRHWRHLTVRQHLHTFQDEQTSLADQDARFFAQWLNSVTCLTRPRPCPADFRGGWLGPGARGSFPICSGPQNMQVQVDQSRPKASAGHLLNRRVPDGRRRRYHFVHPNLSHCQAAVGPNPKQTVHTAQKQTQYYPVSTQQAVNGYETSYLYRKFQYEYRIVL